MKPELDRVKKDLETMQKALGLAPSMGRDWIRWMKRDRWSGLWWCVPGFILIATALLPYDKTSRHFGLVMDQWAGVLICFVLAGLGVAQTRKVSANDGRPEGLIREMKRLNGMSAEGLWFSLALGVQLILYFFWGWEYHIRFEPFWAGLFILTGASFLVAAAASRVWALLGWAVPFIGYGLCLPLAQGHGKVNGVLFGLMFIAVALSFSFISTIQIRMMERQNVAN